jgi:LmbE family N-acetylglucosaminyl deacetylase
MYICTTVETLGLQSHSSALLLGTIEEQVILTALEELSVAHPDHADMFIVAADRVRSSRSAGFEVVDASSVFARTRQSNEIQLRQRGEMAEIFEDLTIDMALRGIAVSATAPAPADVVG